jgi:pilus assembly protein Flp/PilA
MLKLITLVQAYNTKEDGATAIEYGLIAAGVALAIAVIVFTMGGSVAGKFTAVNTALNK